MRNLIRQLWFRALILFVAFGLLVVFSWNPDAENRLDRALAYSALLNFSHPLEYDSSLGMFGQSDHVGLNYPFSAAALRQPVPTAAVAAGLQPSEPTTKVLSAEKEVVHQDPDGGDSNAVLCQESSANSW